MLEGEGRAKRDAVWLWVAEMDWRQESGRAEVGESCLLTGGGEEG